MEKLTMEDIAEYLPHDIHVIRKDQTIELDTEILYRYFVHEMKPILKPSSDIIKMTPMNVKLKDQELAYIPLEMIIQDFYLKNGYTTSYDKAEKLIRAGKFDQLPHWLYRELLKHHYDVKGLIRRGLAVNYNELK